MGKMYIMLETASIHLTGLGMIVALGVLRRCEWATGLESSTAEKHQGERRGGKGIVEWRAHERRRGRRA